MARVHVENVGLRFAPPGRPPVKAVQNVSLEVADQEFVAIVGPSGCGKSSLLSLIAGLHPPSSGTIRVDDRVVTEPGRDRGMVFQSYTLFPWLTVRRNVEFGPSLRGAPKDQRRRVAQHFIEEVGLAGFEDAYPKQLSGGMMQRVALARSLANDPDVLLMDEPFGALDSQTRSVMQQLLLRVWEHTTKTVIFVTHDIDEAILLGDRVLVMTARPGRIKAELTIPLERPRSEDLITSSAFIALKREIMEALREEIREASRI